MGTEMKAMTKYHNRKVQWGVHTFDSMAERDDYIALFARQQAGEISCLRRQVRYCLQEGYTDYFDKRYRGIYVVWDFSFREGDQLVCWDTKGFATPAFRLKERLFRRLYPDIKLVINYAEGRR